MGRPKKPLVDRIRSRSYREAGHLIWKGHMRKGSPHLNPVGNPARILLGLTQHSDYQIRRVVEVCREPRCIDPEHYRVIKEKRFKYSDVPNTPWNDPRKTDSVFSERELIEIEEAVELLLAGELQRGDLDCYPSRMREEISTRMASEDRFPR